MEIGQAAADDQEFKDRTTKEKVLHSLPIICHLARPPPDNYLLTTPNLSFNSLLCYNFMQNFCNSAPAGQVPYEQIIKIDVETSKPMKSDHFDALLDHLRIWLEQRHLSSPTGKIYWNIFFQVLASRCKWMVYYSKCICAFNIVLFDGSFTFILDIRQGIALFKETGVDRDGGQAVNLKELFSLFLQEARQLSCANVNPTMLICCSFGILVKKQNTICNNTNNFD